MMLRIVPLVLAVIVPLDALALSWRKDPQRCEPPDVFYSQAHEEGNPPCCPLAEGRCPGGGPCPASGYCPPTSGNCPTTGPCVETYDGAPVTCTPPSASRPNVVLFLTDDQGSCSYGAAGECYSTASGEPIPAPSTPALDDLAVYATTFPIAHNTSHWCLPSLAGIITARYQKDFVGGKKFDNHLTTYPKALRTLGCFGSASCDYPADPYEPPRDEKNDGYQDDRDGYNVIGGYCTYFGGKFVPRGADASAKGKKQGHTLCGQVPDVPGQADTPPECGTNLAPQGSLEDALDTPYMGDFFEFVLAMVHPAAGGGNAVQRFFAWHFPHLPHEKLTPQDGAIVRYLFGAGQCSDALNPFLFKTAPFCPGADSCPGCTLATAFTERDKGGNEYQYYGNVWHADENLREIRGFLDRVDAERNTNLADNTVIIHFSDNPWFMPASKKNFTENGYRTRLIVYDPTRRPVSAPAAPRVNNQPVHTNDVLPTIMHYATGGASTACPASEGDGQACAGTDLTPLLYGAAGTKPDPLPADVPASLCGHDTRKAASAEKERYLLTAPHATGRCLRAAASSAPPTGSQPGSGHYAGSHVWPPGTGSAACTTSGQPCCPNGQTPCPVPGGICLGRQCRAAPACTRTQDCWDMFGGPSSGYACIPPDPATNGWCRNDPNVACAGDVDCPRCPAVPSCTPVCNNGTCADNPNVACGSSADCCRDIACERVCAPRLLKFYVGSPEATVDPDVAMTDLLLDPNEVRTATDPVPPNPLPDDKLGLLGGRPPGTVAADMSGLATGPYRNLLRHLNCCVDAWWMPDDGAPPEPRSNCNVAGDPCSPQSALACR